MHSSCFKNVCYATFKNFDLDFGKIFCVLHTENVFIFLFVGTKFMVICRNKTVSAQIRYLSYFTTYQNWFWDTSEGYRKHLICINIVAYCNHYTRQQNIVRCLLLLFMKIYMVIVAVQSIIVTRSCINLFFLHSMLLYIWTWCSMNRQILFVWLYIGQIYSFSATI